MVLDFTKVMGHNRSYYVIKKVICLVCDTQKCFADASFRMYWSSWRDRLGLVAKPWNYNMFS